MHSRAASSQRAAAWSSGWRRWWLPWVAWARVSIGSGQDFFRAPLQIFFFIFRGHQTYIYEYRGYSQDILSAALGERGRGADAHAAEAALCVVRGVDQRPLALILTLPDPNPDPNSIVLQQYSPV